MTRTEKGGAYRRRYVVFEPRDNDTTTFAGLLAATKKSKNKWNTGNGVRATRIEEDDRPGPLVYDPGHPDANADGYVARPNVNIVMEMVDMITASRAYEANTTAISSAKSMALKALDIGK